MATMPSIDRTFDRGSRAAQRQLATLGGELRERRLSLGLSQDHTAKAARVSRSRCSRIEAGLIQTFSVVELNHLAAALGLDAAVRLYPGGVPVRDAAHAGKLQSLLRLAAPPLRYRLEVPLPDTDGRDRRAWDAVLFGHEARTSIELEMRLRDLQALLRRVDLKRRDDPSDRFLLLVADTRHNRRVLAEFAGMFPDLPRLRPTSVRNALAAGDHPPTGLMLV
jgi:transcriptional regulator with XRE-family HTH domain